MTSSTQERNGLEVGAQYPTVVRVHLMPKDIIMLSDSIILFSLYYCRFVEFCAVNENAAILTFRARQVKR